MAVNGNQIFFIFLHKCYKLFVIFSLRLKFRNRGSTRVFVGVTVHFVPAERLAYVNGVGSLHARTFVVAEPIKRF